MDVFDPESCSWSKSLEFESGVTLVWGGAAFIGHNLYLVGGLSLTERGPFKSVLHYNFQTRKWGKSRSMSSTLSGVASAELNGRIYCVGEMHTAKQGSLVYDAASDRWYNTPSPTCIRGRHGIVSMPERSVIMLFGGVDRNLRPVQTVEQYDTRQGQWINVGQMPRAGVSVFCTSSGDNVYAMGGSSEMKSESLRTVDIYDARQRKWFSGPEMITGRNDAGAAFLQNDLYVVGGVDGQKVPCPMERLRAGQWETNLTNGAIDRRIFHRLLKIPTHILN